MFYKFYTYLNALLKLSFNTKEHENKFQQRYLEDNFFQNSVSFKFIILAFIAYYPVAYYVTPKDFLFNALYTLPFPIILCSFLLVSSHKECLGKKHLFKLFILSLTMGLIPILNIALTSEYHNIYIINFILILFSLYAMFGAPFSIMLVSSSLLCFILSLILIFDDIELALSIYLFFVMVLAFVVSVISGYWIEKNHRKNYLAVFKQEELTQQVLKEQQKNKQQEKMLQEQVRLAQLGEMISMIAHQWRQPLGAISNSSIAIQLRYKSKKYDEIDNKIFMLKKLQKIDEYTQVLSHTIDDFRNFFKPDKEKETVALTTPIEKALAIVSSSMFNNNIIIKTQFDNNDKIAIYQNEIMQVLLNLFKNAEDNFMEKKIQNATLFISTKKVDNHYSIQVKDNGGGISSDILSSIFDPYFSTKDEKDGTGLGLYMSKIIIEEHHNGILAIHNTDEGACFTITL